MKKFILIISFLSFACSVCYAETINYPSFMKGINYGERVTYVIGHKHPDSDSVCSAIAYANLKRKLGVKCEARIAGSINAEIGTDMAGIMLTAILSDTPSILRKKLIAPINKAIQGWLNGNIKEAA